MRKLLIAGNWKMNGGAEFTSDLLSAIKNQKPTISEEVDVLVCPTLYLYQWLLINSMKAIF